MRIAPGNAGQQAFTLVELVISGALMSVMGLSSIVGPVLAGVIFDAYRSYAPLLWAGVAVAAGAAVLLGSLAPGKPAADSNT